MESKPQGDPTPIPAEKPASSISGLINSLQKAKEAIPKQQELLKKQPKSPENYFIGRNGTLIETDQTRTPKKDILKGQ